jgi:signal transduction histidine kinase
MTSALEAPAAGVRGILAPVRFARMLQVVLMALIAVCAVRYVLRHEWDTTAAMILGGAAILAVIALMQGLVPRHGAWPAAWTVVVCVLWVGLTLTAPSFAWCAVPLAFQVLQILPFLPATVMVSAMTGVVIAAELRLTSELDPTVFAGPIGIAVATVVAYRALDREATARQRLVDELTEAQAELAAAEHRAGGLAERARLSREIHDSVGQNLTSITLLLQAAEQEWERRPDAARDQVRMAADSARAGLDEVRRVVRDLAPAELDGTAASLAAAVQRAVADAGRGDLAAELRVHGELDRMPLPVASAVIRTVRGALANVVEHSRASRVVVSLTAHPGELRLDIRDDGVGFDARPAARRQAAVQRRAHGRGRGLDGIAERIAVVGGHLDIESAPGEGTTISAVFPMAEERTG